MAPLLSICIPTYNRADLLSDVIESIVKQEVFQISDDVEIVICDNCSTDNTAEVAQNFTEKFPNKVFYYKNEKNIGFDNFERVMSHGNGEFLKLNNDTLIHKENSLKTMLNIIKSNRENKRQIFFLQKSRRFCKKCLLLYNVDWFIRVMERGFRNHKGIIFRKEFNANSANIFAFSYHYKKQIRNCRQ